MNGRNRTELEDRTNARGVIARIFTELRKIEDTDEGMDGQEHAGDMAKTRIAVPCVGEAELQAPVSPHFGNCDSYAIVTLADGRVESVGSLSNAPHADCASPVQLLAKNGVDLMLVVGMGMRPYLAFKEMGIEIRQGVVGTVEEAIELYIRNETLPFTEDALCGCHDTSAHGNHR
jgi:predicted Fe-Mo cluster-binding NifX family protein